MNREIKFRTYKDNPKKMIYSDMLFIVGASQKGSLSLQETIQNLQSEYAVMQYTGQKDQHGTEIYDCDIFRVEENGDGLEAEDRIYYLVVTWIKEWCMFATLLVSEYNEYLQDGIKALDEPLFWTYNLRDTEDKRFFLCGNIYETPELLTNK